VKNNNNMSKKNIQMFTAKWCLPCKNAKRILKEHQLLSKIELIDVDTEEGKEKAQKHNITEIPSFLLNGRKIKLDSVLKNLQEQD
jgi:glutaredoxin